MNCHDAGNAVKFPSRDMTHVNVENFPDCVRPFQKTIAPRVGARTARVLLFESDPEASQIEQNSQSLGAGV